MNSFKLLLITVFLGQLGMAGENQKKWASQKDVRGRQLSETYFSGPYLIYDCARKYYACVDLGGKNTCEESRRVHLAGKDAFLPCAYFKRFDSPEKCHKAQRQLINRPVKKTFCQNLSQ